MQAPMKHHVKFIVVVAKPLELVGVFISVPSIRSLKLWDDLPNRAVSY